VATHSDHRQETIRSALLHGAGANADAKAMVEAALALWQRLCSQLAPIIGDGGVQALYARTLHLQRITLSREAAATLAAEAPGSFLALKLCLEGRETAPTLEAAVAFLHTFSTLLNNLIGDALTARLLNPVWAEGATDKPAQENEP
jgi:hypothetical protein